MITVITWKRPWTIEKNKKIPPIRYMLIRLVTIKIMMGLRRQPAFFKTPLSIRSYLRLK